MRLHGEKLDGTWTFDSGEARRRPQELAAGQEAEEAADGSEPRLAAAATGRCSPRSSRRSRAARAGRSRSSGTAIARSRTSAAASASSAAAPTTTSPAAFPTVVRALEGAIRTPDCALDGEVVAIGEDGRATFSAMQQGQPGTTYVYVAFDVLEVDGEPLVDLPLVDRRRRLDALVDRRAAAFRSPKGSTTAQRSTRRRSRTVSRGSWPSGSTRPYRGAAAPASG